MTSCAAKIAQPGNGAWVDPGLPPYAARTEPISLQTFSVALFPRDPATRRYAAGISCEIPLWRNIFEFAPWYEAVPSCRQKRGEIDIDRTAVVNNPSPKDRLNLRREMDTKSEYLGKYNNGTEVCIFSGGNDEWARVFVGNNAIGYMQREYLATGDAMAKAQNRPLRFRARACSV